MSTLPDEVLEGAVFESRGSFTLAQEKAREKMRRFQLEDPRKYLLQFVQALVASGATALDVAFTDQTLAEVPVGYELTVDFDGPGYTFGELERLYDWIFTGGGDRLRELALGVLSCQGIPADRLEIHSNGAVWEWDGREATLSRAGDTAPPTHRIRLQGPAACTEARLLGEHCQAVPIPLRLNGHRVNSPEKRWAGAVPWPAMPFRLGQAEGVVGLPYKELTSSRITFYRHGVAIGSRSLADLRPPVAFGVEAPALRKNVSQTGVVEDDAFRGLVGALPGVVARLALDLARRTVPAYHREEARGFLLEAMAEWLPPEVALGDPAAWPEEVAALAACPLFADRRGARHSLLQVRDSQRRDGFVAVCSRRMPYAPLGDWLLLNPDPEEERLLNRYFRVVNVDAVLPDVMRQGGGRPAVGPPRVPRNLAVVQEPGLVFAVPDRHPDGKCRVRWGDEHETTFEMRGWSVDVRVERSKDLSRVLRTARALLEQSAPDLYGRLLRAMPTDGARRSRVREHLVSWWRSRVEAALGDVPPADLRERVALCRAALGEEAWAAEVFDTRAGPTVTLADVEAWVAGERRLVVAVGGPRREGDFALDGSPAVLELLARLFGAEVVERATLRDSLVGVDQRLLPRASEPGALEEEPPSAPSEPSLEEAARELMRSEPEAVPEVVVEVPPAEEEPPETPAPAALPETVLEQKVHVSSLPALASHAFQEAGLAGYLAVTRDPAGVLCLRGAAWADRPTLFGRALSGWVEAAAGEGEPDAWTPAEEDLLRGQVEVVYERLAEWMAGLDPESEDFALGRRRLAEHLAASPSRTLDRIQAAAPHDAAVRLRFLPLAGGGLGSLLDLWPEVERRGFAPVCSEMWPEEQPSADVPVAMVGSRVPELFYQRIFQRTGTMKGGREDTPAFRLLASAVRELRQARERGDYRLAEEVLEHIEWSFSGPEPVVHDPRTGRTRVNREHRAVKRLLRHFGKDPSVAALLASAIFSAVNRALEDVGDEDEIRFLEALLETAPGAA